jgi:acyl carrier protein
VTTKIKEIIAGVAGLKSGGIGDEAALRDDLNLDSLSLLEIAVEVDFTFKLGLSDEAFRGVASLPEMVDLVLARLGERPAEGEAAGA